MASVIAWWSLNEESGDRADSSGNGRTLTDHATVLYGAGKQGNAADFEKDNGEYLSRADEAALSMGDRDMYFACWLKLETLASVLGYYATLLCKYSATAGKREYDLMLNTADKAEWNVRDGTNSIAGVVANTFGGLSTGIWYFVECWHDAANNLVGVAINRSGDDTAATGGTAPGDTTAAFQLAARDNGAGAGSNFLDGMLDEVVVLDYIPSNAWRDFLYGSGDGITYAEFIAGPPGGAAMMFWM